jgi:hypothetical protein
MILWKMLYCGKYRQCSNVLPILQKPSLIQGDLDITAALMPGHHLA